NLFADAALWSKILSRWHESGRPFNELDTFIGDACPTFREWVAHPEPDAYWDAYNPTPEQYAHLEIPVLTITGCYDGDQPGALEHYRQHLRYASPFARERHYLIIGPWDHGGTGIPKTEFAGLKVGQESV